MRLKPLKDWKLSTALSLASLIVGLIGVAIFYLIFGGWAVLALFLLLWSQGLQAQARELILREQIMKDVAAITQVLR